MNYEQGSRCSRCIHGIQNVLRNKSVIKRSPLENMFELLYYVRELFRLGSNVAYSDPRTTVTRS